MMQDGWPTVSVVFLAYNRRDELAISLAKVRDELGYPRDRVEVIVVDNASVDGTSAMVGERFPDARLITRSANCGVSGWNDGFAVARGQFILVLDDDCYLPPGGLPRAVEAALAQGADLVSFGVVSAQDPTHRFDRDEYHSGLLSFWGCAALVRRGVLTVLRGFDPEIFIHAHEPAFMLRFFDRGYRHLHLPDVIAVHMRAPTKRQADAIPLDTYRLIYGNWAYTAGKLLRPRDAAGALIALWTRNAVEAVRVDRRAWSLMLATTSGFARGLRRRVPVRAAVSRTYRHDFETFANPWAFSRTPLQMLRDRFTSVPVTGDRGRRDQWIQARRRFYPEGEGLLQL